MMRESFVLFPWVILQSFMGGGKNLCFTTWQKHAFFLPSTKDPHASLGQVSVCLPVSLYCWLSPFIPQPDDKRGLEFTTEAVQEPLSNPSIEKGTAAVDWSWWPANSYTWWWLRWYGKLTIPPSEPPNWAWGGSSILLSIISQAKGNDVWWLVMWI